MFQRYAMFFTPALGALAEFGASWLGWDSATAQSCEQIPLPSFDLAEITATPRKYGFHATLRAPFRPNTGISQADLQTWLEDFAQTQAPVNLEGLELTHQHGFVALRPTGDTKALNRLAGEIVRASNALRAPLNEAELERRLKNPLSKAERRNLDTWGYPYVMDAFQFHMTLSGRLPSDQATKLKTALDPVLSPLLPKPFVIDAITLLGEDSNGMFHQLHRSTFSL